MKRAVVAIIMVCSIFVSACTTCRENVPHASTENNDLINPPNEGRPDVNSSAGGPDSTALTHTNEPEIDAQTETIKDPQKTLHKLLSTDEILTAEQIDDLKGQAMSWQLVDVGVAGETVILVIEPSDGSDQQVFISQIRLLYDYNDIIDISDLDYKPCIYTFETYRRIAAETSDGIRTLLIDAYAAGGSGEVILVYEYISDEFEWLEAYFGALVSPTYQNGSVQEWLNITDSYASSDANPFHNSPQQYINEYGSNITKSAYSNEREPSESDVALFKRVTAESERYPGVAYSNPVAVSSREDIYAARTVYRFSVIITVLAGFFEDDDTMYKAYVYIAEPFANSGEEHGIIEDIYVVCAYARTE
ncbi:MAG: hypothetical protein FWH33_08120 [Oscillospiraceae bacterium]|nr:hypothetical protein [Oscillospiraceae bacterium]